MNFIIEKIKKGINSPSVNAETLGVEQQAARAAAIDGRGGAVDFAGLAQPRDVEQLASGTGSAVARRCALRAGRRVYADALWCSRSRCVSG